ncbi:unnamed protein product [Adineta steineri]|uniref:Phosphoribosyltransferase domain-containing protein n=1 Tax=Adineta steineri TaxID=433720 RepID=A0A813NI88_9BILA|nr:unnamed protein product [Adineta steineri]
MQASIMISDQTKTNGFILSSASRGFSTFACLISCIVFLIIAYHLYYNHVKREDKITVVLCGHIYLTILIYSLILLSMNIRSILGDLYNKSFDSSWCIFAGYLTVVLLKNLIDLPNVQESKDKQIQEAKRRKEIYRGKRKPLENLSEKTVILVDDGLATGATMKSAINTCKHLNAKSIIVAVPCGSVDRVKDISTFVDNIICLTTPYGYHAVGQCYKSFDQTTDKEVIEIMAKYQDSTSEDDLQSGFEILEILLTQTPNLQSLVISNGCNTDIIDAFRW